MPTVVTLVPNESIGMSSYPGGTVMLQPGNVEYTLHGHLSSIGGTGSVLMYQNAWIQVGFQSPSLPADAVVINVGLYAYMHWQSPGVGGTCYIYRAGNPAPGVFTDAVGSSNYYTNGGRTTDCRGSGYVYPLTYADLDGFQGVVSTGSGESSIGVDYLYLQYSYTGLPSVTATGPTGTIKSPSPTVTWNFAHDFSQSKFRVRIFSQAQYTAGGFDPAASASTWDSGVQTSSNKSINAGGGIQTSGTYRAFVIASAGTVRVDGTTVDQWSTWGTYTQFTVALPSAYVYRGTFVLGQVKIWNGASFNNAVNVRYWTGSSWANTRDG